MDWSRRQFGLWTTAALLLPSMAAAGKSNAGDIQVTAVLQESTDSELTYLLTAIHTSAKGLAVEASVADPDLVQEGQAPRPLLDPSFKAPLAYLNGEHPFSRRLMQPHFVDLPPNTAIPLATLTIGIGPAERSANHHIAIELTLNHDKNQTVIPLLLPTEAPTVSQKAQASNVLAAIDVTVAFVGSNANDLSYTLTASNGGPSGVSMQPAVGRVHLEPAIGNMVTAAFLNDLNPRSRRKMLAPFVDVGPASSSHLATLTVQLQSDLAVEQAIHIELVLTADNGLTRSFALVLPASRIEG